MLQVLTKRCSKCGVEKPVTDFHAHPQRQYHPRCKPCRAEAGSEYYRANRDKFRAYKARKRGETLEEQEARIQKRRDEAPGKLKLAKWKAHIQKTLGVTPEQYAEMLDAQGGRCAICHTTEPGGKRERFCIDHCHSTGKVRGLLCVSCNSGLGYFKDDADRLSSAATYLRQR